MTPERKGRLLGGLAMIIALTILAVVPLIVEFVT